MEWWQTIISVALGAILTPLTINFIENSREKKSIKPELIKLVYQFFNLRKVTVNLQNTIKIQTRESEIRHNQIISEQDPNNKQQIEKRYIHLLKFQEQNVNTMIKFLSQLNDVEAEICSKISSIKSRYNSQKYTTIDSELKSHLDESNTSCNFFDYDNLSELEFDKAHKKFNELLDKKNKEFNLSCDKVIKKINSIL